MAAHLEDDVETMCRAAALVLPRGAAFSHETSAALHHLPTRARGRPDQTLIDVTVARETSVPVLEGVRGHDTLWLPGDVAEWRGLALTTPARTWCDLAASGRGRLDLLVMADAMLSGTIRSPALAARADLERHVALWHGRRGVCLLREVLGLASDRVDSPMETLLRLLILDAGLPRPLVNEPVCDQTGVAVHRPDLSWPPWKVAVEYDGAHHFAGDEDGAARRRRMDVARVEDMQDLGWIVRVMTRDDLLGAPRRSIERIRLSLRERGADV